MSDASGRQGLVDRVQLFSMAQATQQGGVDVAASPNSNIGVLRVAARSDAQLPAGESDRIVVVLRGECSVELPTGTHTLQPQQGMLIPPGLDCRFTNATNDDLVVFSMQTKRPTALVANVESDVRVKVPVEYLEAKGIGHRIYAYVMDRRTIGLSPIIMEEWNQVSAVRMNCNFERDGDQVVVTLPGRLVQWYRLADLTDADYTLRPDRTRTRVRVDITPFIERHARG